MNRKRFLFVTGTFLFLAAAAAGVHTASAHGPWGGGPFGMRGASPAQSETDMAEALGTTVDKLRAAQDKVFSDQLAAAVKDGRLTQERADLMIAGQKLARSIDPQAMMAQTLGVSAEELQKAQADGKSLNDLVEAKGLDRTEMKAAMQAAHEAAIAKAVKDGVITQAQADQLKDSQGGKMRHFGGMGGMRGFGRMGGCQHGMDKAAPNGQTEGQTDGSGGVRFRVPARNWGGSDL
jgi:hypothetical protein